MKPDDLFAETLFNILRQQFKGPEIGRTEFVDCLLNAAWHELPFYWWVGTEDSPLACLFYFDMENGPGIKLPLFKYGTEFQHPKLVTIAGQANSMFEGYWDLENQ